MSDEATFDPDSLRKEFADYCADVEPGIKVKAPKLNQLETLALIGMSVFQAAKELKAEKAQQAARIAKLEDRYGYLRRRAVMVDYSDETVTKLTLFKDEGPTGEFLDDWVDGQIAALAKQQAEG